MQRDCGKGRLIPYRYEIAYFVGENDNTVKIPAEGINDPKFDELLAKLVACSNIMLYVIDRQGYANCIRSAALSKTGAPSLQANNPGVKSQPMQKSPATIAAEWHNGQSTALYAYASTQSVQPGLALEINECLTTAKPRERAELYQLYVSTAPAISMADLKVNCEFWHRIARNADGTPLRCRKSGAIKTWKTRPGEFRQPVKYGLKTGFYLTPANISEWCLPL